MTLIRFIDKLGDCEFSEFGDWSTCTKLCGGGTQLRTREIKQQAENGGKACGQGESTQTRPCNAHDCAGTFENKT